MKLKVMTKSASGTSSVELPVQFNEPIRKDLIKRAVLTLQANNRQAYGAKPEAGKRASAFLSKRRRKYKGTYGIGQSRTPRKVMSRNGTRFFHVGAFAPQTVGGRRAHPPKADKIWDRKLNEKENRKAIRSALSSTVNAELVKERGHKAPESYPFIIADEFQTINKTAELKKVLVKIGFENELERTATRKIRAGKGKTRGRKYKKKKGILFVVSDSCDLEKSSANIAGSDIVHVQNLNVELLAPGAQAGRLTLFTESAIKKLNDTKLFTIDFKGEKVEKKKQLTPKKEAKKVSKKAKTSKQSTASSAQKKAAPKVEEKKPVVKSNKVEQTSKAISEVKKEEPKVKSAEPTAEPQSTEKVTK